MTVALAVPLSVTVAPLPPGPLMVPEMEYVAAAPIPLRLTVKFPAVIPSEPLTASPPERGPVTVGVNVTLNAHEEPARTPAAEHAFVCEKSPVIPMLEN